MIAVVILSFLDYILETSDSSPSTPKTDSVADMNPPNLLDKLSSFADMPVNPTNLGDCTIIVYIEDIKAHLMALIPNPTSGAYV